MQKITSFTINHIKLQPGIYVSRKDPVQDTVITTFDLRMTSPNEEPVMNTAEVHTIEHLGATFLRNHPEFGSGIIYFGPMGCRTGFYLIMRDRDRRDDYEYVKETLEKIIAHDGEMFGASPKECGNYRELDLEAAKREAARYLRALKEREEAGKADLEYDRQ